MSRPISDIIDVDISVSALTPTVAGFGTGIIVGPTAPQSANRLNVFASLADVADEYATDDPEYLAATAYFGQSPAPDELLIGRRLAEETTVAESFDALTDEMAAIEKSAYAWTLTAEATADEIVEAAAWCEAAKKMLFYTDREDVALIANSSLYPVANDVAARLSALGYIRTVGVYSGSNDYAAVSAMARALIVDFTQPNSTITLKFKTMPGVSADNLTATEIAVVKAKDLNFYTIYGNLAMLAEGVTASGRFVDEVEGLDWLQADIETNVFAKLAGSATKIPQTDAGVLALVKEIEKSLAKGVSNGLLAPGVWTGDSVGEVKTDDYLPTGYYVYAQPVADQSAADRAARFCPPITAICCGAGAIHSVSITVNFQR